MSTVAEIYSVINQLAPFSLSMDFDNTGILVGDSHRTVECALLALDCTSQVIAQAVQCGAQLIITHHPIIFHPLKHVTENDLVYQLVRHDIAVISAHTNLDITAGGVNDVLAAAIGLQDCQGLEMVDPAQEAWLGRIGKLSAPTDAVSFAKAVKAALNAVSVKFVDGSRPIQTVALCSGSGADCLDAAIAQGADALLTSEVKHHEFLQAAEAGITLLDAGHFDTEDIVIEPLRQILSEQIQDVRFFTCHHSNIQAI